MDYCLKNIPNKIFSGTLYVEIYSDELVEPSSTNILLVVSLALYLNNKIMSAKIF